jgi:purine-binding chemotaxis protein CheW
MDSTQNEKRSSIAGKYLTFCIKEEYYGVNVNVILQIIAVPNITPIPRAPHYVKGVINLRGRLVPVIDLRERLDIPKKEYDDRTSIIIFEFEKDDQIVCIGIIVDKVVEVLDIHDSETEKTPSFGSHFDPKFILGMAKVKNKVVSLLDALHILLDLELPDEQTQYTIAEVNHAN